MCLTWSRGKGAYSFSFFQVDNQFVKAGKWFQNGRISPETYQELEDAETQHFKSYADMALEIEPVQYMGAHAEKDAE